MPIGELSWSACQTCGAPTEIGEGGDLHCAFCRENQSPCPTTEAYRQHADRTKLLDEAAAQSWFEGHRSRFRGSLLGVGISRLLTAVGALGVERVQTTQRAAERPRSRVARATTRRPVHAVR